MLKYINHKMMGGGDHGWLNSIFHFSFADYYNESNMNFGVLRVVNDDLVQAGYGFDMHFQRDMEIISYIVEGEITHEDTMGHRKTLTSGQVQYMSAGTGLEHSEHNYGKDTLRLLQIWIFPDGKGGIPKYAEADTNLIAPQAGWIPFVTSERNPRSEASIQIGADAHFYIGETEKGGTLEFDISKGRQAYLVLIEGKAKVGEIQLNMRDALESVEESISIEALEKSKVLLIEMAKG